MFLEPVVVIQQVLLIKLLSGIFLYRINGGGFADRVSKFVEQGGSHVYLLLYLWHQNVLNVYSAVLFISTKVKREL